MRNSDIAENYISHAEIYLQEAHNAFKAKHYNIVVRRAQESVEMCLKAFLIFLGIDYPLVHDVGKIVGKTAAKKVHIKPADIKRIEEISQWLANRRELAFYGSEKEGLPPSVFFTKEDGEKALADAGYVM